MEFFKREKKEEFSFRPFRASQLPLEKKLREKEKPKGDPRWVLGLLLGSILISLLLWGWGNFLAKEKKETRPEIISKPLSTPTVSVSRSKEVISKISGLTSSLKGSYGIYVYNLTKKEDYGLLTEEVFTAASLIKLPVILNLYQEVEAERINLETKYTLKQADKLTGAGSLQFKPAGTVYTYRQLAELMGKQSDNTAFNILRKVLGDQKIQEAINKLGMSQTSLAKNETTPADIGLFFRKLYGGSIVTREHREEILEFLTNTIYEDRIPAGVSEGTRVAHKIGNEIGIFADAGIVFADRPFILVMMSKNALEKEAKVALPKITQAVWEFETKE